MNLNLTWQKANDQFIEAQRLLMIDMKRLESVLTEEQQRRVVGKLYVIVIHTLYNNDIHDYLKIIKYMINDYKTTKMNLFQASFREFIPYVSGCVPRIMLIMYHLC